MATSRTGVVSPTEFRLSELSKGNAELRKQIKESLEKIILIQAKEAEAAQSKEQGGITYDKTYKELVEEITRLKQEPDEAKRTENAGKLAALEAERVNRAPELATVISGIHGELSNLQRALDANREKLHANLQEMNQLVLENEEQILNEQRPYSITLVAADKMPAASYSTKENAAEENKKYLEGLVTAIPPTPNETTIICQQDRQQQQQEFVTGQGPKRTEDVGFGYLSKPSKFFLFSEIKPADRSGPAEWGIVEMTVEPRSRERRDLDTAPFPKYWNKDSSKQIPSYKINSTLGSNQQYRFLYDLAETYNPNLQSQQRQNHPAYVEALETEIKNSNSYLAQPYEKQKQLSHERKSEMSPREHVGGPGRNPELDHKQAGMDPLSPRSSPSPSGLIQDSYSIARNKSLRKVVPENDDGSLTLPEKRSPRGGR